MFPYKSNAFHAYQTNRNPLKLRLFAYLIAIAALLGVLVFTEARAVEVDDEQCKFLSESMIEMRKAMEQYEILIMELEENSGEADACKD